MQQFPAFMAQYPWSTRIIPTSYLLPAQWPHPQNDELLLAMEESEYEDKCLRDTTEKAVVVNWQASQCNEIRKACSSVIIIGKATADNDKEEVDNDADDDDADNAEESEGDEFDQETR